MQTLNELEFKTGGVRKRLIPYGVGLITLVVGTLLEAFHIRMTGIILPMGWPTFVIGQFINQALVVIFLWNGWVFLLPLLAAFAVKLRSTDIIGLWLLMSIVFGATDTFVSFNVATFRHYAMGITSYMFLFGVVYILVMFLLLIIIGLRKCLR